MDPAVGTGAVRDSSADYPLDWGHDLSHCYAGNGWSVVESVTRRSNAESRDSPELYIEVDLLGQNGEHGLLLYSLVNQAGRVFDVPQHLTWPRDGQSRLQSPLEPRLAGRGIATPSLHFHKRALVRHPAAKRAQTFTPPRNKNWWRNTSPKYR